jgi:hypothetical protein
LQNIDFEEAREIPKLGGDQTLEISTAIVLNGQLFLIV